MTPLPQEIQDQVTRILELIEGGSSERAACMEVGMNRSTFRSRALTMGAADQYARATANLARDQVERIEEALDKLESGNLDPATVRVLVDSRKWIASKLFPKQWGDKTQIVGGDPAAGDKPVQVNVTGLSESALAEIAGLKVEGE